jgi:hypothetical protein
MKLKVLFLISILFIGFAKVRTPNAVDARAHLELKQEILLLENNAFRNILKEQNLSKRSQILEQAINNIESLRSLNPVQLKADELSISKMVQNLKKMNSLNQAQYAVEVK